MPGYLSCFFLLVVYFVAKSKESEVPAMKRILMNDPSYIQSQLDHFQSEIQDLMVKTNSQQATIGSLQATISTLQSTVNEQNSTIHTQQSTISDQALALSNIQKSPKEVHFFRWGRKDCPGNFELLYSGYAGGSYYTHKGAAAEYVCMPPDPIWGPRNYTGTWTGYIYGAEYEIGQYFEMSGGLDDVPCAVCEATGFSTSLMIPGRTECYPGWTRAYYGELASGYYDFDSASQYACVDMHPQALVGGGKNNDNGKLFYPVKSVCGSLPCPPYEDGRTLSCVVCVK